ncbi:MAG: MFS transporter [Caldilineaceae bacterium]
MSNYLKTLRLFSPKLRLFLLGMGVMAMVPFGIIAVLFNLYLLRLGFDARYIGLLAGLGQLVWAASALPAGLLGNRIGLRNSMEIGIFVFGTALALVLLVELLPQAYWPAWLLGSQMLLNVGVAIITVSIPAYLMALTGERERKHAFGLFAALIPTAAFLGSLLAGVLPGFWARQMGVTLDAAAPYKLALWAGPILCWLAMLPLLRADPGRVTGQAGSGAADERAPIRLLVFWGVMVFLAAIGEGAVRTFYNVFLDGQLAVPPATIGLVMGIGQLLPIAAALALPLLLTRWGTGNTLLVMMLASGVCLVPLAMTGQLWVAASAYMAIMAAIACLGTSRDLFGQELVIPRWRTSSQGVAMIGMSLGWAAAGVIGGVLIDAAGFSVLFLAGALAAFLAAGLLFGYLRRTRRQHVAAAALPEAETAIVPAEGIVMLPEP